jgi:hypothetical protein
LRLPRLFGSIRALTRIARALEESNRIAAERLKLERSRTERPRKPKLAQVFTAGVEQMNDIYAQEHGYGEET